jgi:hypothetical protein
MIIQVRISGHPWVLHLTGEGLGSPFHLQVYPNMTQVSLGVDSSFKSHPWITHWAPEISVI